MQNQSPHKSLVQGVFVLVRMWRGAATPRVPENRGPGHGRESGAGLPVMAGPFEAADFEKLVPADKKLDPAWVRSLFARGAPTVYRGAELEKIGMPVGGICAGQLYLGGDGKLWHWDIFNQQIATGDAHYAHPPKPDSPLEQGFALRIATAGKNRFRPLDHTGFSQITFCGEYPIGTGRVWRSGGAGNRVARSIFAVCSARLRGFESAGNDHAFFRQEYRQRKRRL